MNADLQRLKQLLKEHDWYYNYSDDHNVWKRGETRSELIREAMLICEDLGYEQEAKELWSYYSAGSQVE